MEKMQEDIYACPSFNSYSSDKLAEIAVKVAAGSSAQNGNNDDDEDFEFSLVREDREILADELFYDGQTGPIFPVFNRDLLNQEGKFSAGSENERLKSQSSITVPLSKLFIQNRELGDNNNPPSGSSSEDDEMENIPTYCVWRPKAADSPSPSRCKKSRSTGSMCKKWSFRDLLRRSNSEGKDNFVFLSPKNWEEKLATEAPIKAKGKRSGGAAASPSAHEALYTRNRAIKLGDKKKSYLPYRQDLVGFFANANGLGKGYPRF